MEHQPPQPDCIIKIEAVGCCENCAKRVRKKIARLEGVDSVEIDRERRWAYIGGDVDPQLLVDYLTQRIVKPESVKLIYYCSKEATSTHHRAKNQTPMENKSTSTDQSHVKETNYCPMASDHANDKREGGNYNQQTPHHTKGDYDPNHYAPRKDWVHRRENYVAQPQKQDQYHPSCECRNPSCDFHAWKRQGTTNRFDFDMHSASARWYHEPIMRPPGQFPYI